MPSRRQKALGGCGCWQGPSKPAFVMPGIPEAVDLRFQTLQTAQARAASRRVRTGESLHPLHAPEELRFQSWKCKLPSSQKHRIQVEAPAEHPNMWNWEEPEREPKNLKCRRPHSHGHREPCSGRSPRRETSWTRRLLNQIWNLEPLPVCQEPFFELTLSRSLPRE